ncbi:MAG: hypothetical protein WCH84_00220 [Verrucomicrobiota bacterium]
MSKPPRTFVGFGFGAIQGGLFLYEAFRSGNFDRLVVAEVLPDVVAALRHSGGRYRVNVATPAGLEVHEITGIEALNPKDPTDRIALLAALGEASEICTALPSVDFFSSVAPLLAEGLRSPAIIYTAENNNHAAELLEAAVRKLQPSLSVNHQFLNTVIGKMSGVVTATGSLVAITDDLPRAFLVEEFNRILITQISVPGFRRGIEVFAEKPDLLPFEEAKLYGHNAVHALLGYLANQRGYQFMSDLAGDAELMQLGREAFLVESGPALIARRGGLDPLFTPAGYQAYAEDLLRRMTNPWLSDAVVRIIRDPRRKLSWQDRLIGTMRLALDAGIQPVRFAKGARAAVAVLAQEAPGTSLDSLWPEPDEPVGRKQELKRSINAA